MLAAEMAGVHVYDWSADAVESVVGTLQTRVIQYLVRRMVVRDMKLGGDLPPFRPLTHP